MPQGFSSAARNLFLLGSTGQEVVTNFFRRNSNPIDASTSRTITALKHDDDDGLYRIAGNIETTDSGTPQVGFLTTITSTGTEAPGTNTRKISSAVVNGVGDVSINALHYAPSDGDLYVVGGRKRSDEKYPYIYKMLANGNPEWSITSRRGEAEYHDICVGSDDKIYVVGHTTEHSGNLGTALIESVTELSDGTDGYYGDWSTVVSFEGRTIVLTSCSMVGSDTLVACGWISEDISDKGYIVKVDTTDGTILWEKTLEYFLREEDEYLNIKCSDVFLDDNGQIYVTANGDRLGNPPIKGFLLKYTAEGNVIWQKESPFVSITEGFSFDKVTADTETEQVVVLGGVNAGEAGLITKYTKSGEQSWRRTITPDTNPSGVNFRSPVLDGDPSFYYLGFIDDPGSNDSYIFGSVSSSGNGLGSFEYDPDGGTTTISYDISSTQDVIGRINDGSVQNNSSDLITYPFTANKILFDDLATNLSHKKRRSDSATPTLIFNGDTWRPVEPSEMYLTGDDDTSDGPELIKNGTFDSDVSEWTAETSTLDWVSGRLQTNRTGGSGYTSYQAIPTEIGKRYTVRATVESTGTGGRQDIRVLSDLSTNGGSLLSTSPVNGSNGFTVNVEVHFTAVGTTSYVYTASDAGGTGFFDNISVKESAIWSDRSGKGNNAIVNGPTNVRFGTTNQLGYWDFDGTDYKIIFGPKCNELFEDGGSGTIEMWVRLNDVSARQTLCSGYMTSGSTQPDRWDFEVQSGIVRGGFHDNGYSQSNPTIGTNTWYNFMFVLDKSIGNGEIKLYINAVEDSNWSGSLTVDRDFATDVEFGIGNRFLQQADFPLDGDVGEVRVYPRALSEGEIFQNYNHNISKYGGVRVDNTQLNNTTF